jgi:hypothetical protein
MSLHGDKLRNALQSGPVRAIGGIVYDAAMKPLMNTTEMHGAVQELNRTGLKVGRVDAGGSPTWAVEESVSRRIHENAMNIANLLLEDPVAVATDTRKSCGMCEREFGVHDPDASHGNCKRHTIASYQQMIQMNPQYQAQTMQSIKRVEAMPDSNFPPDLRQHPEIVAALGKKDYATHDRDVKAYMDTVHRQRGERPI